MPYLSFVTSLILFLFASSVVAQHEVGDKSNEIKSYSGKQSAEWEKIQQTLGTIKGKLEAQTVIVKNLIDSKNQLKGEALDLKLEELKKEYITLQKITDNYNKVSQDYLTKFPERGTKTNRVYRRIRPKSLRTLETELTVQGQVNRLHAKILSQYQKTGEAVKKNKIISQNEDKNKSKNPESADVTEKIELKK